MPFDLVMPEFPDARCRRAPSARPPPMTAPLTPSTVPCHERRRCRVLVIGADNATYGLLAQWLEDAGCEAVDEADAPCAPAGGWQVVVVEVPFPRDGLAGLRQVGARHPGVPVLALSATFLPHVARSGETARALGVAGVLPKPLQREALVAAVRRLSEAPP